jgi:hypothetical protein
MDTENTETSNSVGKNEDTTEEIITKRITVKKTTITKMMGIRSLFNDELSGDAKDTEVISYFLDKSFECLLKSGETARRLQKLIE